MYFIVKQLLTMNQTQVINLRCLPRYIIIIKKTILVYYKNITLFRSKLFEKNYIILQENLILMLYRVHLTMSRAQTCKLCIGNGNCNLHTIMTIISPYRNKMSRICLLSRKQIMRERDRHDNVGKLIQ